MSSTYIISSWHGLNSSSTMKVLISGRRSCEHEYDANNKAHIPIGQSIVSHLTPG